MIKILNAKKRKKKISSNNKTIRARRNKLS